MTRKKIKRLISKVVREELKRKVFDGMFLPLSEEKRSCTEAIPHSRVEIFDSLAADPPSKFITEKMMDMVGRTLTIKKMARLYTTPTLEVFDASIT